MLVRVTSDLDYGIDQKSVKGVDILDQPLPKKCPQIEEKAYNPVREYLNGVIREMSDNPLLMYSGATFTISDKKLCGKDLYAVDDLIVHRSIRKKLQGSKIWNRINYIMCPEFGTKDGRLHYHCIFWDEYQTTVAKAMRWWTRNYGYVKPEMKINNISNWKNYCIKDSKIVGLGRIYNIRSK